jgi:hypothetical protein
MRALSVVRTFDQRLISHSAFCKRLTYASISLVALCARTSTLDGNVRVRWCWEQRYASLVESPLLHKR